MGMRKLRVVLIFKVYYVLLVVIRKMCNVKIVQGGATGVDPSSFFSNFYVACKKIYEYSYTLMPFPAKIYFRIYIYTFLTIPKP